MLILTPSLTLTPTLSLTPNPNPNCRPASPQARILPSAVSRSRLAHSACLPSGLYILPALISFFLSFFSMIAPRTIIYYRRIYRTDFRNLFTERKRFGCRLQMIDLDLFFRYLKGRCHGNQFCGKMTNSPHLPCPRLSYILACAGCSPKGLYILRPF